MKISLLKAPTFPYPEADRGEHVFTYSLFPHTGDFKQGKTVKEGYLLNMPLEASCVSKNTGNIPSEFSLAKTNKENVVIETVKKAEEDNSIVLRAFETYNSKTVADITVGFNFKKAYICNMLENEESELKSVGKTISVSFKNFEIITIKFII